MTKDCYFRLSNGQETIPGWQKGAWRTENIFRKEEQDWQMVCFFQWFIYLFIFIQPILVIIYFTDLNLII